ncbi:hypothetical protein H6501_00790 [Candidatus Woesearchaeota archaeon]|nr:hypothetical protein [Nanoarchaeota archaeon]MCB9370114.1 hypothetical protein [Candidatus Woesearchaeota archaeon]USN44645.1 MAG: hypothetical protein H6500_02265 [Candidatus Woesearchaeota archaeon]
MILDFVDEPFNKEQIFQEIVGCFNGFEQLVLYHGTTNLFKDQILSEGLKARYLVSNSVYEGKEVNGENLESNPNLVYIGSLCMARWLGINAPKKYGGNFILFQLLLDRRDLLPDEDSRKTDGIESLVWEGSAAIQSHIPPERIIGYSEVIDYCGTDSEREFLPIRPVGDVVRFTYESHRELLSR